MSEKISLDSSENHYKEPEKRFVKKKRLLLCGE